MTAMPLAVTFDEALERLAALPNLFTEPDGSFVWRSAPNHQPAWQVDGQLFDRGDTLFYVELKGICPAEALDALLGCCRIEPGQSLVFEWAERGTLMGERPFRELAGNEQIRMLSTGD